MENRDIWIRKAMPRIERSTSPTRIELQLSLRNSGTSATLNATEENQQLDFVGYSRAKLPFINSRQLGSMH